MPRFLSAAIEVPMNSTAMPLALILSVCAPIALAADPNRGRTLHNENCIACHEALMRGDPSTMYTRSERQVGDQSALLKRVRDCQANLGLQWSDEDLADVVSYLNREFYKF